jgi:hypothetical protein
VSGNGTPSVENAEVARAGRAAVRAFATMWRNARIYAPSHPRVSSAIEVALTQLASLRIAEGSVLLQVRDRALWIGNASLPLDDPDAVPLIERLRDVGLRGFEFGPICAAGDLLAMLDHLQHKRGRSHEQLFASWPIDQNNLRPLQLIYDGHFDANPGSGGGGTGAGPGSGSGRPPVAPTATAPQRPSRPSPVPPHVQQALERLSADATVQARLRAVDVLTKADTDDATIRVDVLERIGTLLPADVGADSASIEGVVKLILERLERDLAEVVRLGARVRGGGLLRLALDVARQFFRTSATPSAPRPGLPSGRPEDDKITADVDLLLAELEDIPPGGALVLPKASDLVTAREVLGAFLHTLIHGHLESGAERLVTMLRKLFADHGERLGTVLDPYLRVDRKDAIKEPIRLQILEALVEIGGPALPCARRYIDAQFLAAHFPERLPLCARALGGDQAGREVLRQGLEKLAPMLAFGGLEAAERARVLTDPAVAGTLLAIDGPVVRQLLPVMARQATGPALEQLLAFVRTLPLLPATLATLDVASATQLPDGHLPRLLTNFLSRRPGQTIDQESIAILNGNVLRAEAGPVEPLLRAIDALRHAGGPTTIGLLQRLARHRRLRFWDRRARLVRERAAHILLLLRAPS